MIGAWMSATMWLVTVSAAAGEVPFTVIESDTAGAVVTLDPGRVADYRVPETMFALFTENLGENIYGGFWAQLLQNPSLESIRVCLGRGSYLRDERLRLQYLTHRDLAGEVDLKRVAYGWFPWNETAELRLDGDAFNTTQCQFVATGALPEGSIGAGICQPVVLPTARTRRYLLKAYVKDAVVPVVALLVDGREPRRIYARAVLEGPHSSAWQARTAVLEIAAPPAGRPRPMLFCLGLDRPGSVRLDQVTLLPDDAVEGFEPQVLDRLKTARIPALRFPGGNYVSGYHFKDDLVPMEQRPTMRNPAWAVIDPHHVGTDEHMRLCQLIGAEPVICVNAGNGTPEEAADWVQYCNGGTDTPMGRLRAERGHPQPFGVRWWEVGNELWGPWQVGHCDSREYARRYRAFVEAMRKADPSIRLIACGHLGHIQADWNEVLIRECGEILDTLAIHLLMHTSSEASPFCSYMNYMGYSHTFEDVYRRIRAQAAARGVDLKVAVTECMQMTHHGYQSRPAHMSEALYYAGAVNGAIRTQGGVDWFFRTALINHGGGLHRDLGVVYADPVWYAHEEFRKLAGGRQVACTVRARHADVPEWQPSWAGPVSKRFPLLDVMPLRYGDELRVVLVNRDAEAAMPVRIELGKGTIAAGGQTRCWTLAGETWYAMNEVTNPSRVQPAERILPVSAGDHVEVTAPPASLSVLTIPLLATP